MLGVGIGWLREEFEALGVPFEKRGARFDDYVTAIRKIWSGEMVEHKSEFLDWSGWKSYPVPVQSPMPVIMGGIKGKIHERVAKLGNGWFAPTAKPQELKEHLDKIRAQCDAIGRDFAEIDVTCMWAGQGGEEGLAALTDVGVHRVVVPLQALGPNPIEGIQKFAEENIK